MEAIAQHKSAVEATAQQELASSAWAVGEDVCQNDAAQDVALMPTPEAQDGHGHGGTAHAAFEWWSPAEQWLATLMAQR